MTSGEHTGLVGLRRYQAGQGKKGGKKGGKRGKRDVHNFTLLKSGSCVTWPCSLSGPRLPSLGCCSFGSIGGGSLAAARSESVVSIDKLPEEIEMRYFYYGVF